MAERFRVPNKCIGITMPDGRKYDARGGTVEVPDRDAGTVRRSHTQGLGLVTGEVFGFAGEGKSCACGFSAWPWQTICPRCGREVA